MLKKNPEDFKGLVEALGFNIIREFQDKDRLCANWGRFTEKKQR